MTKPQTTRIETEAIELCKQFIGPAQFQVMREGLRGEESQHFMDKIMEIGERIKSMPKTYEQDGKGGEAIVSLHYFTGGCDFYITEKDCCAGIPGAQHTDYEPEQHQAFGLADLGYGAELGYISIVEILENGAELDLYFKPCTLAEIEAKGERHAA